MFERFSVFRYVNGLEVWGEKINCLFFERIRFLILNRLLMFLNEKFLMWLFLRFKIFKCLLSLVNNGMMIVVVRFIFFRYSWVSFVLLMFLKLFIIFLLSMGIFFIWRICRLWKFENNVVFIEWKMLFWKFMYFIFDYLLVCLNLFFVKFFKFLL